MEVVASQDGSKPSDLRSFLQFLFEGLEGVAYVAEKNPSDSTDWSQHYFVVPKELDRMESVIQLAAGTSEVYVAPAVYSKADYRRENFKASNVVWTEFDGNAPTEASYNNPPSLRILSSVEGHEHCYWRLSQPITDVDHIEEINRRITYGLSADSSAWDATQVLRPPNTLNHKRNAQVNICGSSEYAYDVSVFEALPEAPRPINAESFRPDYVPEVSRVILKYSFPQDAIELFSQPKLERGTRSTGLMQLAYFCCEMGMSDAETYSVIKNADDRWEKFANRRDQAKRLAHIISIARHKHPSLQETEEPYAYLFPFNTFLQTEVEIDWVLEGMLMENGSMLMVGPSGIGKTQLSMRAGMQLALGQPFLHYAVPKPRKMLFLSLEMGHGELKVFAETMGKTFSGSELERLEENFIVVPHGEKWALNTPVGQEHLIHIIEDVRPDGILIDSVGSALAGSLNNDEHIQDLVDFNDRIRKKYDLFLWYIHHMRKASNGGHAPTGQDDVYGNQYLVNRSTSTYGLLRAKSGLLRVRNFKNRLIGAEQDYLIERTSDLNFKEVKQDGDEVETITYKKPESEKGPGEEGDLRFRL